MMDYLPSEPLAVPGSALKVEPPTAMEVRVSQECPGAVARLGHAYPLVCEQLARARHTLARLCPMNWEEDDEWTEAVAFLGGWDEVCRMSAEEHHRAGALP